MDIFRDVIEIEDEVVKLVGKIADENNFEAYVVGGYVRDLFLGKEVKDVDFLVIGEGIKFARIVAKHFRKKVTIYEQFRTAMIALEDRKIEFVGARKESYRRDSRKPIVESGSLEDDLARRDFTINAIAVSINEKTFGKVIDPYNGRKDLIDKIIRTPLDPEKTFDDDPLRMMRAVRFACQLNFTIEEGTLSAIKKMKDRLIIVSQERITDEFLKIMQSPKPSIGLRLMQETSLMSVVLPEVAELEGTEQRTPYHHKDVFQHTCQVVDNLAGVTDNVWLRLAGLFHDIAKPKTKAFKEGVGWTFYGHDVLGAKMVRSIFRRMKLPIDKSKYVEKLVRLHLRPMALVDENVTDSAIRRLIVQAGEDLDDLIKLCRADITTRNPKLVEEYSRNYDIVVQKIKEVEEKDRLRAFKSPVDGNEIMQALGLNPGPLVGRLKKAIEEAILEGVIPNEHDAAFDYLMKIKDQIIAEYESEKRAHSD
ncbi:HDIG domain-containing protein [Candidatus Kryptobacter tengchongensis]|uniref:CCA tRNA nucleotidyltransferase n=1 Tax=Kryptobacter tengchongensis TaxID=1643429 RepID=UPI0007081373|nr:CCA tRNA nucleotidyltransferase [Candidatus Kryptobacter tengchongensis]CUS87240.1 HDIG domain-containing protein [Candidatus Kryptobacter tengchongensis]CUU08798.1 HDIG domain-containing protein [Candidatus Kryptobacter tengchongensis]